MKLKLSLMLATGLMATAAFAHPPQPNVFDDGNYWKITAYDDSSPGHTQLASQGICFQPYAVVGTQIRGVWYSDTFPDWNGRYAQEGDQVFLHGDYAKDVGHDGMQFEIVTRSRDNLAAGHWKEWREDGSYGNTIGFANTTLTRIGKCEIIQSGDLTKISVLPRLTVDGRIAENPGDKGQIPLESLQTK
ncbi:MAG: hypothetical protein PVJ39_13305 [Gammaproteobacteria bacterium]|jgi:hypothetical protein